MLSQSLLILWGHFYSVSLSHWYYNKFLLIFSPRKRPAMKPFWPLWINLGNFDLNLFANTADRNLYELYSEVISSYHKVSHTWVYRELHHLEDYLVKFHLQDSLEVPGKRECLFCPEGFINFAGVAIRSRAFVIFPLFYHFFQFFTTKFLSSS